MKKSGISALSEWGKDKPRGVRVVAQAAVGAESLHKWMKAIKREELLVDNTTAPALKEWLSLYKRHRHVEEVLIEMFKGLGGVAECGAKLVELDLKVRRQRRKMGLGGLKKKSKEIPLDEGAGVRKEQETLLEELDRYSYDDIQWDMEGKIDEDFNERFKEDLKTPEMLFYLKVWAPCFYQYGEFPGRLMRKARLGDINAIERILRVDPSVIGDPKICEHFHRASWERSKVDFNTIAKALQRGPKGRVTLQKVKYTLAGFISMASEGLGKRLEGPEIRELFKVVDPNVGEENIDTNLPEAETFAKAIERYRKHLSHDKK